jgi:hypothetical protein
MQMKKTVIALLACVAFAGTAMAAPDVIEMKRGVKFDHKAHKAVSGPCVKCHATESGGKIEGFGKTWAHDKCKACHVEMKKGPTACKECHK